MACPSSISSCGCTIVSSGYYELASDLSVTSASSDCIDIRAANVNLWLDGHSITGMGGGIGLHLLRSASNAFVEGLDLSSGAFASIGSFTNGIQDDASAAVIAHTNVSYNSNVGILLNHANGSLVSDFSAESNAYGVELDASTLCSIQRVTLDSNSVYGLWLLSSSRNIVNFFEAQDNTVAGIYVGCQATAGPVGGRCAPSNRNHIYDGPQVGPAAASQGYGVAIDSGSSGNVLAGIYGSGDATDDLDDQNAGCGSNVWFNNIGSRNASCIH
ncbi:MAG TPA: right-handed parallel beta-helix repeat-containing protein [Candidatus Binataceae bacterium]|nr:right-handed parallel beta-helix repeat-containing protein [Candidatus Binataceae bacterium]